MGFSSRSSSRARASSTVYGAASLGCRHLPSPPRNPVYGLPVRGTGCGRPAQSSTSQLRRGGRLRDHGQALIGHGSLVGTYCGTSVPELGVFLRPEECSPMTFVGVTVAWETRSACTSNSVIRRRDDRAHARVRPNPCCNRRRCRSARGRRAGRSDPRSDAQHENGRPARRPLVGQPPIRPRAHAETSLRIQPLRFMYVRRRRVGLQGAGAFEFRPHCAPRRKPLASCARARHHPTSFVESSACRPSGRRQLRRCRA